jgi:hypothetical protein
MSKEENKKINISSSYLTLLLKFQPESEAAVLSSLIAFFDIDSNLGLGLHLIN